MYSSTKLKTAAECDNAIALATERKNELVFQESALTREMNGQEKSVDTVSATLVALIAQINGFNAAIATMPDGEAKRDIVSKVRRLNDQRENLEERLEKAGAPAYLDTELQAELARRQVTEIDAFIAAINQRKTEV